MLIVRMKLFHLYRVEDQTGVSGTGPVVEGVEFTNGWCAIRWLSNKSTLCFYQSIEDVRAIHGHQGRTELIIHDFEPAPRGQVGTAEGAQFEVFLQLMEKISETVNMAEEPDLSEADLRGAIREAHELLDRLESGIRQKHGLKKAS